MTGAVMKQGMENRARLALRKRFGGSQTKTKGKRGREAGFTTQYNDSHMLYKFRRAPSRLRRRVRKFVRGITRVVTNMGDMQVLVRSYTATMTATADGAQSVLGLPPMYGCLGSSSVGCNDVSEIFYSYGGRVNPSWDQKLITKSAVLDYKITAASSNPVDMYVDAYYCTARRDIPTALSNNTTGLITQCFSNVGAVSGGSQLTMADVGVTPFDNSEFCKLVKITKVRRYKIAAGDSISIQIRDPRDYIWSAAMYGAMAGSGAVNESLLARKGVTEWVMVVYYGAPVSGSQASHVTGYLTANRNYHYVAQEHTLSLGDYV